MNSLVNVRRMSINGETDAEDEEPTQRLPLPARFHSESAAIAWAETDVRTTKIAERLHVIRLDGTVIHSLEGGYRTINVPDDVLHDLCGNVFVHSHPEEMSFSLDDVMIGIQFGARQGRIVTLEHTYVIEFPSHALDVFALAHNFAIQWQAESNRYLLLKRSGKISATEAEAEALHEAWRKIARKFGFSYSRKKK